MWTALVWLVLLIPSIYGYLKGKTTARFLQSYIFTASPDLFHRLLDTLFFVCVFSIAFFIYARALKGGDRTVSPATIWKWTALFTLILTFMFPFTCEDVYYYIATGQLEAHYRVNPYVTPARQIAGWYRDPFLSTSCWGFLTYVYGPVWAKISAWLVSMSGQNLWLALQLFKIFAGLVHLLNTALIGETARRYSVQGAWAMIAYGWNPLLLFELPGHAHNDALLLTFLILAVCCLSFWRGILSLPCLTLASLVKFTPLLFTPLFVLWFLKARRSIGLLAGGAISLILVPLWFRPY